MSGKFIDRWDDTYEFIWEPLGNIPKAPFDLFAELYRAASVNTIKKKRDHALFVQIVNNPDIAYDAFHQINGESFGGENQLVKFLEDAFDAVEEFGISKLTSTYTKSISSFIQRFNLRYRLVHPFSLRVQLPWLFADVYSELHVLNKKNKHLDDRMNDFEEAFNQFVRTRRKRDLTTSILKATLYAESVATETTGESAKSLGKMKNTITDLGVWPHKTLPEALNRIYGFCSDYPGIRHSTNTSGMLRELNAKDTILVSALLFTFSSFIHTELNVSKVLK